MGVQVFAAGPLGGVGVASWVPRPGQHLSEAAGRQAEGRQENPVNLEAQEFLRVLGLVWWEAQAWDTLLS